MSHIHAKQEQNHEDQTKRLSRLARRYQGWRRCHFNGKRSAVSYPYGFSSRFEGVRGSNPEELIGAAHASCFTMALSLILGEAKLTAEKMETTAEVTLEKVPDGFAITAIHLQLTAKVPGADQATFEELANKAKAGCPVSKLFKADITLTATLTE